MKIIGITGKSGAGKSTFTEMLGEHENVGIIKIDDLVDEAKKKYFRHFLENNQDKEEVNKNPKLKSSSKKFFIKIDLLFGHL